jgi:5,10-methylenetetrahydromethanopterin reductase
MTTREQEASTRERNRNAAGLAIGAGRPVRRLDDIAEWARVAEAAGFSLLSVGDSQTMWMDPYVAMTLAAEHTSKAKIGPMVTVPRTRHPSVSACAIGSIQRLSHGRAYFAIGPGDSAIYNIGETRVSMAETQRYAVAVRDLCRGEEVTYGGETFRLHWDVDPVPLWLAGDGPKMLEMGGRIADGVVVGSGATVELVEFARKHIAIGAESVGRTIDDVEVWYLVPTHVAPSREDGIRQLRFYLASYAKVRFRYDMDKKGTTIDADLAARLRAFQAEYDHTQQFAVGGATSDALLDKYDLTEWLAGQRLVTGTVDDIVGRLEQLYRAGVRNIMMPQMLPDVVTTTAALAPVVAAVAQL